jgi:hypothetical protein
MATSEITWSQGEESDSGSDHDTSPKQVQTEISIAASFLRQGLIEKCQEYELMGRGAGVLGPPPPPEVVASGKVLIQS